MCFRGVLVFLFLMSMEPASTLICSRFPPNTLTPKSPVDENFAILITNNPQTYILGQEYNITLNAFNGHRYVSFSLALENDNGYFNVNEDLGQFKIIDPVETRFSPNCINMVESTNTNPKTRSEVTWIAPTDPNSGCVLIRATLLQHRDVWHMDDGGLTRRICQEVVDEVESRRSYDSPECCACDEARYELTFQGLWNRNLHPKDFPPKGWITRFGDIIGAAHATEYRFWKEGEVATDGMKEYAEHGSSRTLERDFNSNFQQGIIRTIIKARGPSFPNLNGISVASVRVDPKHHLISLASKIDPSPDWFVGISGMELCMKNCTWLDEKVIQLYPWDSGTDAGPTYTSADQPQVPPDVIRRMRSNFPNDPRSPFYDETGAAMAPLASLTIKRQRVYERTCEDPDSNNDNIPRECHTHPWTRWSECSVKCGEGHSFRTRVYKQPELAKIYNCDAIITLRESRSCSGVNCYGSAAEISANDDFYGENSNLGRRVSPECELTPWSDWSECSNTCGEGTTVRRREYVNIRSQVACQNTSPQKLIEINKCFGKLCLGDLANERRRPYSVGSDIYNEEDDTFSQGDVNGHEYWNSASGNDQRSIQQYGNDQRSIQQYGNDQRSMQQYGNDQRSIQQYGNDQRSMQQYGNDQRSMQQYGSSWTGENFGRGDERHQNQYYRPGQRHTSGRGGYENEQFNEPDLANANGVFDFEEPDTMVQYPNRFEVGDLQSGNQDTFNHRVISGDTKRNSFNEKGNNRKNGMLAGQQLGDGINDLNTQVPLEIPQLFVPAYCFDKLEIFNCLDPTVVGNFWFFNYCENECMLFAADKCDRNENKFTSLEACESMCQRPANEPYLKYQQERNCIKTNNRRSNKRRKTAIGNIISSNV